MPKSLLITCRTPTRPPQHQTTRLTSRFQVATLRIVLQGRTHPTGAVAPTCRREYGLVNAIPAGYESDDSWDNVSHTHDHTHMHNIVPLLTLRPWRNSPRRAPEQQQFRQQNINKRAVWKCTVLPTVGQSAIRKAHLQPTSASCQSLPQSPTQVSITIDSLRGAALV